MSKEYLDWTATQGSGAGFDMLGNTVRKYLSFDAFEGKTQFKAIVLTDAYPLNDAEGAMFLETDYNAPPSTGSAGESAAANAPIGYSQYIFKARIIGENSPHAFIPDPANPIFLPDPQKAIPFIMMHTSFVTDVDVATEDFKYIQKGDEVLVELEENEFSYNLQFGKFISITKEANPLTSHPLDRPAQQSGQQPLAQRFNEAESAGSVRRSPGADPAYKSTAATAGTAPQNTDATVLSVNHSKVWPWTEEMRNKTITLVLFYHGVGFGDQDYIINNKDYGMKAAFKELGKTLSNTLFLVPKGNGASWSSVSRDIEKLQTDYGISINQRILGGWSGGSLGGTRALNSDTIWNMKIWADPSPGTHFLNAWNGDAGASNYQNNIMYYRDANWGAYDWSTPNFAAIAAKMQAKNGAAYEVGDNHKAILKNVFKIIGRQVS